MSFWRRQIKINPYRIIILFVAILVVGVWWLDSRIKEYPGKRALAAFRLVQCLNLACTGYELEYGEYPPGDGSGSASLYRALSRPGPQGKPFLHLQPEQLENGHVINPAKDGEIIFYRRNQPIAAPDAKNKESFDIWGVDHLGNPEGINNWE